MPQVAKNLFAGSPLVSIKGMEIFKEGIWNGQTFDATDMNQMVENFNKLKGQVTPILKITHRDNQESLAGLASYGDMVNMYKLDGEGKAKLYADFDSVPLQVAEWIKDRRFPQRSIELSYRFIIEDIVYRNVITAVSLLGSEMPAVAGMEPVKLSSEDSKLNKEDVVGVTFELDDEKPTFEIINQSNQKKKGGVKMDELTKVLNKLASLEDLATTFLSKQKAAEAKLSQEQSDAEKEELKKQIAQYSIEIANLKDLKADYESMKASLEKAENEKAELKKKAKEATVKSFIDKQKADGHIIPAFEKEAEALLMALDSEEKVGTFSKLEEGKQADVEMTQFELFQNLLVKLPKLVEFKEMSQVGDGERISDTEKEMELSNGDSFELSGVELDIEAKKYAEEHKCSYEEAVVKVSAQFKAEGKPQGLLEEE